MLINVKMPTTVGIVTFMSRINFVLSCVKYENSFITSGPDRKKMELKVPIHTFEILQPITNYH